MARKHTDQYIHHSKKILCDFDFTKLRLMYFFFKKKKDLQKSPNYYQIFAPYLDIKKFNLFSPFFPERDSKMWIEVPQLIIVLP